MTNNSIRLFEVWLEGTYAMLQHRFPDEPEEKKSRQINKSYGSPREQAEKSVYREPSTGFIYFPSSGISRLVREAGGSHKQKGSRRSLKYIVPAALILPEETMPLYTLDRTTRISTFEVDSRPVTIPATKGRVMRHRPRIDQWTLRFFARVNENILDAEVIRGLLIEGGQQNGLGDYRPANGGPFGTFHVVSWLDITEEAKKPTVHTNGTAPAIVS
jgi:hypothetical protein